MDKLYRTGGLAACVVAGLPAVVVAADFEFVEVGPKRGIEPYVMAEGMGAGVAAADYDDDGDVDLFVPNGAGGIDQLYRNLGDGSFEEIADDVGVASTVSSRAALWLDADGDGRLDLLVARDGWHAPKLPESALRLLQQQPGGTFTDVTTEAGVAALNLDGDASHIGGLCAADVDGDGALDVCMTQWDGSTYVFLNDGDGVFTDISVQCGIGTGHPTAWQPLMYDVDGDGRMDLFVAVDFSPNHLWINQPDGTFADVAAEAGVDSAFNEMGAAFGDYDNDLDLDLYITNIHRDGRHNRLYRNDTAGGVPAFVDVATDLGVENSDWGWGTTFLDADRDGWLDLAATNGFEPPPWRTDASRFFLNRGGTPDWFEDVSAEVGFDDTEWGSSLVALDMDRDGDLDLVQTCNLGGGVRVLDNRLSGAAAKRGYLVVQPRMEGPNGRAIGALVRVTTGGLTQTRLITCGTSFLGQEPAEAFFGLGDAATADVLRVEWPDGRVTVLTDVAGDRVLTLYQCAADLNADRVVDFADILDVLSSWGPCPPEGVCLADIDGDDVVGFSDILVVLSNWGPCP